MEGLRAALVLFLMAAYTTCKPMDWPHHLCAITGSHESAESNESSEEDQPTLSNSTPLPILLTTAAPGSGKDPKVRSEGPPVDPTTASSQTSLPAANPTPFAPVISDLTPPPTPPVSSPGPSGPTDFSAGTENPPAVTTAPGFTTHPATRRPESRGDDV